MAARIRIRWAVISRTEGAPSAAEHGLDRVARDRDDPVDLGRRHHQGRREEDHLAALDARDQPALGHLRLDAGPDLRLGREERLRAPVLDELERGQEALPAPDVADVWVVAERRLEALVQAGAPPPRAVPPPPPPPHLPGLPPPPPRRG